MNSIPLKLELTAWIAEKMMTKEEKLDNPKYKDVGGYLKVLSYENAWAVQWRKYSQEEKQKFLDLPHFNAEIFKSITGIDVSQDILPDLKGKEVEVKLDGKIYKAVIV